MPAEKKSLLIGTFVPIVGILVGVVVLAGSTKQVLGFPVVFAWLFLWMPLTTICLQLAWRIDRHRYADDEAQPEKTQ